MDTMWGCEHPPESSGSRSSSQHPRAVMRQNSRRFSASCEYRPPCVTVAWSPGCRVGGGPPSSLEPSPCSGAQAWCSSASRDERAAPTFRTAGAIEPSPRDNEDMGAGDFELTMDELRAVVGFGADCAQELLPEFEAVAPHDARPRDAIDAARLFADGAARSNLQRTAAFASHRAAKSVSAETAQLAALACGDAAAAAYLHPIAKASQVGHILRAAACVARVAELRTATTDSDSVSALAKRATPPLPEVLRRYPVAQPGSSRVSQLMSELDSAIRNRE